MAASPCNTGSPSSKGIPLAPRGSPQLAPGQRHPALTWLCLPRTGPRRHRPLPPQAAERQRGLTEAELPRGLSWSHNKRKASAYLGQPGARVTSSLLTGTGQAAAMSPVTFGACWGHPKHAPALLLLEPKPLGNEQGCPLLGHRHTEPTDPPQSIYGHNGIDLSKSNIYGQSGSMQPLAALLLKSPECARKRGRRRPRPQKSKAIGCTPVV